MTLRFSLALSLGASQVKGLAQKKKEHFRELHGLPSSAFGGLTAPAPAWGGPRSESFDKGGHDEETPTAAVFPPTSRDDGPGSGVVDHLEQKLRENNAEHLLPIVQALGVAETSELVELQQEELREAGATQFECTLLWKLGTAARRKRRKADELKVPTNVKRAKEARPSVFQQSLRKRTR